MCGETYNGIPWDLLPVTTHHWKGETEPGRTLDLTGLLTQGGEIGGVNCRGMSGEELKLDQPPVLLCSPPSVVHNSGPGGG